MVYRLKGLVQCPTPVHACDCHLAILGFVAVSVVRPDAKESRQQRSKVSESLQRTLSRTDLNRNRAGSEKCTHTTGWRRTRASAAKLIRSRGRQLR
eukprot:6203856-Pleurochrysis_carterae.AAC.4